MNIVLMATRAFNSSIPNGLNAGTAFPLRESPDARARRAILMLLRMGVARAPRREPARRWHP
jgi:hypothetical protein